MICFEYLRYDVRNRNDLHCTVLIKWYKGTSMNFEMSRNESTFLHNFTCIPPANFSSGEGIICQNANLLKIYFVLEIFPPIYQLWPLYSVHCYTLAFCRNIYRFAQMTYKWKYFWNIMTSELRMKLTKEYVEVGYTIYKL